MRTGERVAGLPMHRHRIGRLVEILYGVTFFALVLVRRGGELLVMRIFVAVQAGGKLDFVDRIFAGRQMALVAFHLDVFSL